MTAANWFKDAGYATAHIGKRHLGNPNLPETALTSLGFDLDVLPPGHNHRKSCRECFVSDSAGFL
jgi:arylsulfatase A-like enzyme